VRLVVNQDYELQPMTLMATERTERTYEAPAEAVKSGCLEFTWSRQGARCVCINEVWLIKKR